MYTNKLKENLFAFVIVGYANKQNDKKFHQILDGKIENSYRKIPP